MRVAVWQTIKPILVSEIIAEKARKERKALQQRMNNRHSEITLHYATFKSKLDPSVHTNSALPIAIEVCALPSVKALIMRDDAHKSISYEDFAAVADALPAEHATQSAQLKHDLAAMLRRNSMLARSLTRVHEPDEILERACAYFSCNQCHCTTAAKPQSYLSIYRHWLVWHPHLAWEPQNWPPNIFSKASRDTPWVDVAHADVKQALAILTAVRLPLETTKKQVDDMVISERLRCMCGEPRRYSIEPETWLDLVRVLICIRVQG